MVNIWQMSSFITATAISVRRSGRFHHCLLPIIFSPATLISSRCLSFRKFLQPLIRGRSLNQTTRGTRRFGLQLANMQTAHMPSKFHNPWWNIVVGAKLPLVPVRSDYSTFFFLYCTFLSFRDAMRSSRSSQCTLVLCIFWVIYCSLIL